MDNLLRDLALFVAMTAVAATLNALFLVLADPYSELLLCDRFKTDRLLLPTPDLVLPDILDLTDALESFPPRARLLLLLFLEGATAATAAVTTSLLGS